VLHLVSLRLHASQAAAESDEEFADSDSPQLSRVSTHCAQIGLLYPGYVM